MIQEGLDDASYRQPSPERTKVEDAHGAKQTEASGESETVQLIFKMLNGSLAIQVRETLTTVELIERLATEMKAPKEKVWVSLDQSLGIPGHAANLKNAAEVDSKLNILETNIVQSFVKSGTATAWVTK